MKIKDIQNMESEEIRIRVAELLGWKEVEGVTVPSMSYMGATSCSDCWQTPSGDCGHGDLEPPNYPKDLNACHDMVKFAFGDDQFKWSRYCDWLLDLAGDNQGGAFEATARQRCEALIMTMAASL